MTQYGHSPCASLSALYWHRSYPITRQHSEASQEPLYGLYGSIGTSHIVNPPYFTG